tara:strand:+ start:4819 stop:4956 length:138 start_codon:yes stop_codon:yes gene_type:complete
MPRVELTPGKLGMMENGMANGMGNSVERAPECPIDMGTKDHRDGG